MRQGGPPPFDRNSMPHFDLANLQACFLDEPQLAAASLKRRPVGQLPLPSGHLVACDPLVYPESPMLAGYSVPPGEYTVDLIIAGRRPALAVVWFQPRTTLEVASLHWEMASWATEDPSALSDDRFLGYPVDAGLGCFMDADTQKALLVLIDQPAGDGTEWCDALIDNDHLDEGAIYRPWGQDSPHALAVFTSGWGDGSYPSYWALDADGTPVALVTDFMIIEGGDDRDGEDFARQVYEDSLSASDKAALMRLATAVAEEDVPVIESLLAHDPLLSNKIDPASGGTAFFEAIRLDKPRALQALLQNAPPPSMPKQLHTRTVATYLQYAYRLNLPRSAAVIAQLEPAQEPLVIRRGFWARLLGR